MCVPCNKLCMAILNDEEIDEQRFHPLHRTIYLISGWNPEANTYTPFPIQSPSWRRAHFWGGGFSSPISRIGHPLTPPEFQHCFAQEHWNSRSRLSCHSYYRGCTSPFLLLEKLIHPPDLVIFSVPLIYYPLQWLINTVLSLTLLLPGNTFAEKDWLLTFFRDFSSFGGTF